MDVAGQPYYYKLAAEDIHGNLSPFVLVQPSGTTGVDGAHLPSALFLAAPSPNPAHGGTALRFGLPVEARVSLVLYDQQGRRIRELVNGTLVAGEHIATWDGHDSAGRVAASGLYFARLEATGRTLTQRVVAIQ